jgi:hypothetical protein
MQRVSFVAGIAVVLVACSTPASPAVESQSTARGSPTTDALASASATASAQTAEGPRVAWSELEFDGSIRDVVADGARFVAVGVGTEGASSWTSDDGRSWTEHDVPERVFGEIDEGTELTGTMGALVRLEDTLYSFGGMAFMDAVAGAGWRWTDGDRWEVIHSTSPFFGGRVTAAVANGHSLVAATESFAAGLFGSYATWRWTPATRWNPTALASSDEEDITVSALAWSDGRFVATGSAADAVEGVERWDWPRTLAMWTSPDGQSWRPVQPPADMSEICAVSSIGPGFVALGVSSDRVAAWKSMDGSSWTRVTFDAPQGPFSTAGMGCRVADAGDGLVAFASDADATMFWTSSDGDGWVFRERLPIAMTAAAAQDGVLVVSGSTPGSAEPLTEQILYVGSIEP